jgi:hypothetical protein
MSSLQLNHKVIPDGAVPVLGWAGGLAEAATFGAALATAKASFGTTRGTTFSAASRKLLACPLAGVFTGPFLVLAKRAPWMIIQCVHACDSVCAYLCAYVSAKARRESKPLIFCEQGCATLS